MRFFITICLCVITGAAGARAAEVEDLAGRVIADLAGQPYELPLLDSQITVSIEGDMATVEVTQTFLNEAHLPVQAEYFFPLNQTAAVYGMEMIVGDEIVTAVIQEKAQAEATFQQAADDG